MTVVTRFAPSPTGYLHVGNVRTALINWIFARANNGNFILRIDDTDKERSKQEYVDGIFRDLEWLGLTWDELHYQSKRMDLYEDAKNKLISAERLYPCFETHEELEIKKKTQLSRNLPPIYDRSSLKLTALQIDAYKSQGINPHYRFKMSNGAIEWTDGVRGKIHFESKNISDPVLVRADGTMTYMIATVVDDIDFKITDIIRGEDHISNSAVHVEMFEALGAKAPNLAHLSLIKSKDGEISKRIGGFDIQAMRDQGIHPLSILSFLAKLGTSDSIEFRQNIKELIAEFNLKKFSKAPCNYDLKDLLRINGKLMHHMEFDDVKNHLEAHITKEFWDAVKLNVETFKDISIWWNIINNEVATPSGDDSDFLNHAAECLPEGTWNTETWNIWVNQVKDKTERKGSELFMPLRRALTGMDHGPELKILLPILGRDKTLKRLGAKNKQMLQA